MQQEHTWDRFWKVGKKGLLTVSVVFNILVLSFMAGSAARRMGWVGGSAPIAAKEAVSSVRAAADWPKRASGKPPIPFEQAQQLAEGHPQAKSFLARAVKSGYPLGRSFSLNYRPADSAFYYLAELAAERCDCEGDPFRKTSLRLFLNPHEGRVFFVDTLKDAPVSLAAKE
jgi:hypothetical protein